MLERSLVRFRCAQDASAAGFDDALAELGAGRKMGHWIWYIFPQLAGLGRSSTAQFYGLADLAEARAYLADAVLGARLGAVTEVVDARLAQGGKLVELMGGAIDGQKLVSSLTLFLEAADPEASKEAARFAAPAERILQVAESQGFPRCAWTLERCRLA